MRRPLAARAPARAAALTTAIAIALTAAFTSAAHGAKPTTTKPPGTTVANSGPMNGITRGVTDTSIKVGGIGYSFLYGGADVGAKARFQRANDTGGVNGRTIEYTGVTDDGGDPAIDSQGVTKIAQQDQVFAVVPAVTPVLDSASLVRQQVPYFGWGLSTGFCDNPYGFGFTGCVVPNRTASTAWGTLVAKALGTSAGKTAAVVTENTTDGQYEARHVAAGLRGAGFRVVYAQPALASPAPGDYNAVAYAVLTSNAGKAPDAVFVVAGVSNVLGFETVVRNANYPGLVSNTLLYAPNLVAPAVGSTIMIQTAATETAPNNPPMQQLVNDVRKIAPDQPIDQSVVAGYLSADLFLAAVRKAGRKLTVGTLLRAANHKFTYILPGLAGPTMFPAAHSSTTPCGSLVSSNGTAFTVRVPYSCGKNVALN